VSLLATVDGQQVVGFLMPRVTGMRPLLACYNPAIRRQEWPLFNYRYLLRTAHNLAAAVRALHARGYVIGDVNESNVLVTETALVTLVDTDSFQVREPHNGMVYRCPVGKPEFTPPELQGCAFAQVDRLPEHDLFGLAALIFQLLMEGTHPFAGVYQGPGDIPPYESRIASGHFPYSRRRRVPYRPKPSAPPYDLLPPTLQALFRRCFETGHVQPLERPDAYTWQSALQAAEQTLVSCPTNEQHLYTRRVAWSSSGSPGTSTLVYRFSGDQRTLPRAVDLADDHHAEEGDRDTQRAEVPGVFEVGTECRPGTIAQPHASEKTHRPKRWLGLRGTHGMGEAACSAGLRFEPHQILYQLVGQIG
jgi:DNA-binding helix-hairpin-helix protein with protein kinase domain